MSKHTPRPWQAVVRQSSQCGGSIESDHWVCRGGHPGYSEFIEPLGIQMHGRGFDSSCETARTGPPPSTGDALLIAAAPELLAACERIASLAAPCAKCDGSGVAYYGAAGPAEACRVCGGIGETCEAGPELHALRAALAKARPEAEERWAGGRREEETMTRQLEGHALDAALARALGWRNVEIRPGAMGPFVQGFNLMNWHCAVPQWSSSLEAMRSVERELERRGLHHRYTAALEQLIYGEEVGAFPPSLFPLVHASAEQRARAALAVLEGARDDGS